MTIEIPDHMILPTPEQIDKAAKIIGTSIAFSNSLSHCAGLEYVIDILGFIRKEIAKKKE